MNITTRLVERHIQGCSSVSSGVHVNRISLRAEPWSEAAPEAPPIPRIVERPRASVVPATVGRPNVEPMDDDCEGTMKTAFRVPSWASQNQDAIRKAMLKDAGRTDTSPLRLPPSPQPPPSPRDQRLSILKVIAARPAAPSTIATRVNAGYTAVERVVLAMQEQGLVFCILNQRGGKSYGITEAGLAAMKTMLDAMPEPPNSMAERRALVAEMLDRNPDLRPRDVVSATGVNKSTASEDLRAIRAARERGENWPSVVFAGPTTGEAVMAPVARKTGGLVQAFLARSVE